MELCVAQKKDLPALRVMFREITENMYKNGVMIWDELYPYEDFAGDIENGNLYLITDRNEITAAFCACDSVEGADCFEWRNKSAKAVYLCRVGVNARFLRQGIGTLALSYALEIAKRRDTEFLRLLVSDANKAAMDFYKKNGFTQVAGTYNEFSEALKKPIVEFGFEFESPLILK